MTSDTYTIDSLLTLVEPSGSLLTLQADELVLETEDTLLKACYLTFSVNLEMYQRIDQEALFNLSIDVRGVGWERGFGGDRPIEIEAKLAPHLLFSLFSRGATAASIAADLLKASAKASFRNSQPDDMLLTDNWYAMYVKQSVPLPSEFGEGLLKEGYQTQWVESIERFPP